MQASISVLRAGNPPESRNNRGELQAEPPRQQGGKALGSQEKLGVPQLILGAQEGSELVDFPLLTHAGLGCAVGKGLHSLCCSSSFTGASVNSKDG